MIVFTEINSLLQNLTRYASSPAPTVMSPTTAPARTRENDTESVFQADLDSGACPQSSSHFVPQTDQTRILQDALRASHNFTPIGNLFPLKGWDLLLLRD